LQYIFDLHTYSFEKLQAWQECRKLVKVVYQLTKAFPDSERFGLINQMRRAAISGSSNLAEGSGRATLKDQNHFYRMAYSSLLELLNQIILAFDLGFISEDKYKELRKQVETCTWLTATLSSSARS
jgi:four helix bundle protein